MTKQQIGDAVKRERIRKGIGPTELASRSNCDESSIRRIESGHCPSLVLADAVLRGLGVKLTIGYPAARRKLDVDSAA